VNQRSSGVWLVVGLGNPGPTYASHRHNVGYLVVEELAHRAGVRFARASRLRAEVAETRLAAGGLGGVGTALAQVVLTKSRTYMNELGGPVKKVAEYYKVAPAQIAAIHDELDIDFGQLRIKAGGGDNGHNGLRSIRSALGTGDFVRIRFGIGRPPGQQDPAAFVLSSFPPSLAADVSIEVGRAADAVECLMVEGLATTQNRYNS